MIDLRDLETVYITLSYSMENYISIFRDLDSRLRVACFAESRPTHAVVPGIWIKTSLVSLAMTAAKLDRRPDRVRSDPIHGAFMLS